MHSIWEGTGNVLALDVLRALRDPDVGTALLAEIEHQLARRPGPVADRAEAAVRAALPRLAELLAAARPATARDLAWSLARTYQLALVVAHARWAYDEAGEHRPAAASALLAARPLLASGPGEADDAALADLALG